MTIGETLRQRTRGEMVRALGVAALIAVISGTAWRMLPHPGANGHLMFSFAVAISTYQLINGGDGSRNLSLRTLAWMGPLLLLQLAFQALVASGLTALD